MINFLLGGAYTIIIMGLSLFVGYLLGSKQFKRIIDAKVDKLENDNRYPIQKKEAMYTGGAVKQIPHEDEETKMFKDKLKSILE